MYINKQDDLNLINSKNPEDLNKLYRKYSTIINGILYSKTRDKERSLDMTQDVLIKIHNNLDKFDKDKPFNRWVYQITVNHLYDQQRNLKFLKHKTEYNQISIDNECFSDRFFYEDNVSSEMDGENNLVDTIINEHLKTDLDKGIFDLYFNKNQSVYEISQCFSLTKKEVNHKINELVTYVKDMNLELLTI